MKRSHHSLPPHERRGKKRGFQTLLVSQMCERKGDLSRKRRSDVGKLLTEEEKANFQVKLRKAKEQKITQPQLKGEAHSKKPQMDKVESPSGERI